MPDWRIYYEGGKTFDSDGGTPNDVPAEGVILILQRDLTPEAKVDVVERDNFYYWGGPTIQWLGSDWDGIIDALLDGKTIEGFCMGRRFSRTEFFSQRQTILRDDPDFQ